MIPTSFPEMYEQWLVGPLFRPFAEMTLDELEISVGDRVLDVACGTGIVARVAKERVGDAGYVVGIDINPDMLAVARTAAPGIEWRQGDATELPLRDGERFDVVVCQQGLQFVHDKSAAAAQMRRASAKGSRLALSTWRADDEIPLMQELRRVAEQHFGAISDHRHSFGDAKTLEALLREAGFRDVRSRTINRMIRFDAEAPFLRLNTMALVGMSAAGKKLADDERRRVVDLIIQESEPNLRSYVDGAGGLAFELSTNLATARA